MEHQEGSNYSDSEKGQNNPDELFRRLDIIEKDIAHPLSKVATKDVIGAFQEAYACKERWFDAYNDKELEDLEYWLETIEEKLKS